MSKIKCCKDVGTDGEGWWIGQHGVPLLPKESTPSTAPHGEAGIFRASDNVTEERTFPWRNL